MRGLLDGFPTEMLRRSLPGSQPADFTKQAYGPTAVHEAWDEEARCPPTRRKDSPQRTFRDRKVGPGGTRDGPGRERRANAGRPMVPGTTACIRKSVLKDDGVPARYAIVTPYFRESRQILERCFHSVRRQTVKVDHIVVADGFAQQWIDDEPVRHFKLDRCHDDYGNTPRGLGMLLAISEQYKGIGLLDADNWLAEDHVERCLEAASSALDCDFVVARCFLMRPDGTKIAFDGEPPTQHVDTSCYFFLEGAYHVLHYWVTMPRRVAPICDRIIYAALQNFKLRSALVEKTTVYYECLWASIYAAIGESPPPGAKPNIDWVSISNWLDSLSERELRFVNQMSGSIVRASPGLDRQLMTPPERHPSNRAP
jgi:hypothetical protein